MSVKFINNIVVLIEVTLKRAEGAAKVRVCTCVHVCARVCTCVHVCVPGV
jgi:hypothetical protein